MSKRANIISNTLTAQKSRIKRVAFDYLFAAFLFLIVDIIVLIIVFTSKDKAYASRILYIVIPTLSAFCVIFLCFSAKRFLLLYAYKRARFEYEVVIDINCKNIRFITYTSARSLVEIIGIIFVDENSKRYVYILPDKLSDSTITRKKIRQKCVGNAIELVCYEKTNMIKHCNGLDLPLSFTCLTK